AVEESYRAGVTDEFVEPAVVVDGTGAPVGTVRDGDAVIFFNFRADRARQITRAFVDREFQGFPRQVHPQVHFVCMTQYDVTIAAPVAFAPQDLSDTLGEVLARHGLRQLRIAETEKYAHVTFFFNGGVEQPNPLEERVLIPSPPVPTYDLKPEMSAFEVTERVLAELERDCFDVIVLNYANPDMVGHTGMLEPAVKAIKAVDHCLGEVVSAVQARGGEVLVTADHGNAETMIDPESGEPHTAHTSNPVPFILVSERFRGCRLRQGRALRDIAPTMLEMLGLPLPAAMTGASLIEPPAAGSDNENGEGRGIG
ncbi:MAG: 2,3-bisphosphoglycerate-independent phosphoglycerate mutase, partial [Syntrophomonadaceae bacterium]|nr:2,3-bisphosphoglycerate-independent phosphoglycerate mutase [Syntrophomonadaceae bacterium]